MVEAAHGPAAEGQGGGADQSGERNAEHDRGGGDVGEQQPAIENAEHVVVLGVVGEDEPRQGGFQGPGDPVLDEPGGERLLDVDEPGLDDHWKAPTARPIIRTG